MCNHRMTTDGLLFQPNASGKVYLSINYHRDGTPRKSKWLQTVARVIEFDMFCSSDTNGWHLANGHLWGLLNQGETEIGTRHERVAKFRKPTNTTDPWHGYPVTINKDKLDDDETTTNELLEAIQMLIDNGAISPITGKRIQRAKL